MSSWNLQALGAALNAALNCDGLRGALNLLEPDRGISQVAIAESASAAQSVLGIRIASPAADQAEAYVRGDDLVATYLQTPQRPSRVQAYWRAEGKLMRQASDVARGKRIDLQISVQTDNLGVATPIETISRLRADEVWRLSPDESQWVPLTVAVGSQRLSPEQGPCCLLFRLQECDWSYVEIVHPADFDQSEVNVSPDAGGAKSDLTLTHRLFPETLEKGVIRRGQLIGAWLPRNQDQPAAASLYKALLHSPPPLTT